MSELTKRPPLPLSKSLQSVAAGERGVEQSFGRAAAILDALASARSNGLRFTDLENETGFSKATLHRLLAGLCAYGFVEASETGLYYVGYQLGAWAATNRDRMQIADRVMPLIRSLSAKVGETAYFSVRAGDMAICMAMQEGNAAVRALPLHVGDKSALGVGSASAAILAGIQDEQEVDAILATDAHRKYCARRNVDEAFVRRHIVQTRRLGYSFVDDLNPDMTGVGVALHDASGSPVAAVSVAAIQTRLNDPATRELILEELRSTAAQLEPLFRFGVRPA